MPSNLCLNHLIVSTWLIRCGAPTVDLARRRLAIRSPGRVLSLVNIRVQSCAVYLHAAVEVHAVNAYRRVVLESEIDVFADAEAEVASRREIALPQLVLLDLEATLENLLSLWSTDGNVHSDLLVTTDTEGTDGVSRLACSSTVSVSSSPFRFDR